MKRARFLFSWFLASGLAAALAAGPVDPALYSGMRWRLVGPFRGGRTLAAAGVPGEPDHFYFGAVGGGVWESRNAGRTWEPIFDGQPAASIGAIAVAPSDPRVVYVGAGEADMRSDISYGNGVYRSADGGATWAHVGLAETRQIGRIVVDPVHPDLVFVAALGHAYGPNAERGVFRSADGGRTWKRVLFRDENTGAVDLAIDPSNPRRLFAAMWETRRPPWNVYSPWTGPGGGLYRSEDGGDTWSAVTRGGFPGGPVGRIGLAFAPSDARRLYALVDGKRGGLYGSRDGGRTWELINEDKRIWERGWYFGAVTVDPRDPETVYVCDTAMYRSRDGGRTFLPLKGAPGGDDYHGLWIDPSDSRRMIVASDQGAVVSVDGARTWSSWYNQPTAQIYHVSTDDRFPYWIYGAQQDSGAVATPSATDYRNITLRDWRPIAGGGESGVVVPDPADPDVLFGEAVTRFDQKTLQEQSIDPTLADPGQYRRTWTLPVIFSPRDSKSLYYSNQFVFKTTDAGRHWAKISPDLSREDPGMPATLDPRAAKHAAAPGPRRGVVYTIAPSPLQDGRLWCGTDDGLVWLTKDDGGHWSNVTPPDLTPWSKVGIIEASHFDPEGAYAAVDRHRLEDLRPHLYRTRDGGRTWKKIVEGIPEGSYVNAVREDPERRGLLYAGTETGVFVSFDDGEHWQSLSLNLPNCSVRDLAVRRGDLVAATHGRSFWVLDDVAPLRGIDSSVPIADVHLFAPREAFRIHPAFFQGTPEPKDEPAGDNPPRGAAIDYFLPATSAAPAPVSIEIIDAHGAVVRRFASDDAPEAADLQKIQISPDWAQGPPPLSAIPGMHRFVWDLRYPVPDAMRDSRGRTEGLWAAPGRYVVRLTAAGVRRTQPLLIRRDPRVSVSDADLERQLEFAQSIRALRIPLAVQTRRADALSRQISLQLETRDRTPSPAASAEVERFGRRLEQLAGPARSASEEAEGVTGPTLRSAASSLQALEHAVESADAAPTPDALAGLGPRRSEGAAALAAWDAFLREDLPRVNAALAAAGLPKLDPDSPAPVPED